MKSLLTKYQKCCLSNRTTNLVYRSKAFFSEIPVNKDSKKIAVIGSGPSGFHLSKLFLSKFKKDVSVDIYERSPLPFGLVRNGIAPDHVGMKEAIKQYTQTLKEPNVNLFCNVQVVDGNAHSKSHSTLATIDIKDIVKSYSAVILTNGAEGEIRLNLPCKNTDGTSSAAKEQDLANYFSSREFVAWYNGEIDSCPTSKANAIDFTKVKDVVIIGNGNVSIDVARILSRPTTELSQFDIVNPVLNSLKNKKIRNIHIVARRGALQAAFSLKEIKELKNFKEHINMFVLEDEIEDSKNEQSLAELKGGTLGQNKQATKKADYIDKITKVKSLEEVKEKEEEGKVNIIFRFLMNPYELKVDSSTSTEESAGKVEGILFKKGELHGEAYNQSVKDKPDSKPTEIKADLVVSSVGYKPRANFPSLIAYDSRNVISNTKGIVKIANKEEFYDHIFASGWCKRGAKGILNDSIVDCTETFGSILSKYSLLKPVGSIESEFVKVEGEVKYDYDRMIKDKHYVINTEMCLKMLEIERERGEKQGKLAEKVLSREEAFSLI